MPHVRAQIREFVRARLVEIPGLEQYVTIDSEEISEDLELPMVHVSLGDESITPKTMGGGNGRRMERQLQLFVDVYCQAKKEPLLQAEEFAAKIEAKLAADPRLGGLVRDLAVTAYQIERSDTGKVPIVQLRMPHSVLYFTNSRDATVPV
jgi:hypothetical protein